MVLRHTAYRAACASRSQARSQRSAARSRSTYRGLNRAVPTARSALLGGGPPCGLAATGAAAAPRGGAAGALALDLGVTGRLAAAAAAGRSAAVAATVPRAGLTQVLDLLGAQPGASAQGTRQLAGRGGGDVEVAEEVVG